MDLFAINSDVARWEAECARQSGHVRVEALVRLAWHLRQRDTQRALGLAQQAADLLRVSELGEPVRKSLGARLQLLHGEAKWLQAELSQAQQLADGALQAFAALQDWTGCADAHWLSAWIAVDAGQLSRSDAEFELMQSDAHRAGDTLRRDVAQAALARWAVLRNPLAAEERWAERFGRHDSGQDLALTAWTCDFMGMLMHYTGDFGRALAHTKRAFEAALETGQIRSAIIAATNVAEDFNRLNDHHAALDWMKRGLDLARPTGWPRSVGACLMHMAETLRYLGNLDGAQELLREALDTLAPVADSRAYAIALQYQGDLALDRNDYVTALDAFRRLEKKADELRQMDFRTDSRRGQAHALSGLDQPVAALVAAQAALAGAAEQGDSSRQIEALIVLADVHARHPQLAAPTEAVGSAALHHLHQAMAVARSFSGYTIPGKLFELLGREYARVGDHAQAYAMLTHAIAAREKTHGQEATNRAIAIQVLHQTERAHVESEYHRQLAASEARRAESLLHTSATLEQLGLIGQEMTTHLDADAIFRVLERYVPSLLEAGTFAVYLVESSGERLNMAFGVEAGQQLPPGQIDIADPHANSARCIRERRELLVDLAGETPTSHIPGTTRNACALYLPLIVGERLLGAITVQSERRHAYAERERFIFRTLSAYAAIALANAQTFHQLQGTQQQLIEQEKMAALGSLVAGISHELNTPIGNGMMFASALSDKTEIMVRGLHKNRIRRAELAAYLADAKEASAFILRSLQSAADLVFSFKQVAVDRTTSQRRVCDLHQLCHEIVATMKNQLNRARVTTEIDVPDGIAMDSYPGPLGQVITNLINNALMHAFEGRDGGQLFVSARCILPGEVRLRFSDNGAGISPQHVRKVFDPFFTTKMGQGGSGLGLSISYNIVTSILNGRISVQSQLGRGTRFTIDLPLVATA